MSALQAQRILYLEREPCTRTLITRVLTNKFGASVVDCGTMDYALEKFAEGGFDAVIVETIVSLTNNATDTVWEWAKSLHAEGVRVLVICKSLPPKTPAGLTCISKNEDLHTLESALHRFLKKGDQGERKRSLTVRMP